MSSCSLLHISCFLASKLSKEGPLPGAVEAASQTPSLGPSSHMETRGCVRLWLDRLQNPKSFPRVAVLVTKGGPLWSVVS